MLKYTFQGLSVKGHLSLYYKSILINKNAKYKRKRVFSKLGPKYDEKNKYSNAEKFVLSLYDKPELRLHEIKHRLIKHFDGKIEIFKSRYVYEDVKELDLCFSKVLITKKGNEEKKICNSLIDFIDQNIDTLLKDEKDLINNLDNLGPNLILLDKVTLEKLKQNIATLSELNSLFKFESETFGDSFTLNSFDSFSSFDNFSDSVSDFDGFGGGDFGGAGSGDNW